MIFRPDDIAPLLFPADRPDLGFHQGTIISFDKDTGVNTIDVAGTQITNIPVLNTSEVITLKAGHFVGLLRFRSTYFILGRITPTGAQFGTASVAFDGGGSLTQGRAYPLTTTFTDKIVNTDIVVPDWADEALVYTVASAFAFNNSGANDFMELRAVIEGQVGTVIRQGVNSSATESVTAAHERIIVDPPANITYSAQMRSINGTWPEDENIGTTVNIVAFGIFRNTESV